MTTLQVTAWKVFVSDVEVGEIPDQTFEQIKRTVRREPRVWIATALDFLRPIRQLNAVVIVPPLLLGWVCIFMAMTDPSFFAQALDMAANDPAKFRQGATTMLMYSVFVSLAPSILRPFIFPTSFVSSYERELGRRLRSFMKVPSDGVVRLEKVFQGVQP